MTVLAQCVSALGVDACAGEGGVEAASSGSVALEPLSRAARDSGVGDSGTARQVDGGEAKTRRVAAASGFAAGGGAAERPLADAPRAHAAEDSFESYAQAALAGAQQ